MKYSCLIIVAFLLFCSGCTSMSQKANLKKFDTLYTSGQYAAAADVQLLVKGDKVNHPAHLLEVLQAGAALRADERRNESNDLFDEAEEIIKQHDEKLLASKSVSIVGATLVNDTVLDYAGYEYDGVMLNTYKALNLWKQGEADARVEFNRAVERQDRAKVRFAKLIAKNKEELAAQQAQQRKKYNESGPDIEKNVSNQETQDLVYSNLDEFEAYADFTNPFTLYAAGLYFMSQGDLSKAENLLKEAHGLDQTVGVIEDDLNRVNGNAKDQQAQSYVWVVLENGLGPELEQFRVDLPLFLLTNDVKYTGIALPRIKLREQAHSYLLVKSGDVSTRTEVIASMDRVVQTEFKKRYPMILSRAIASTLIKTYAQYYAQQELGDFGGIAVGLYQAATNAADTRMWTALPKDFQVARVPSPEDGKLILAFPNGTSEHLQVESGKNSMVYVKAVTASMPASIHVVEL